MRFGVVLLLVAGCSHKLGSPKVTYSADLQPLPVVQPSSDTQRWYVPMESEKHGDYVWFVDTGYTYSTCDDDFIEDLGLDTKGKGSVRGELGSLTTSKAKIDSITLGGHRVENVVCQVRDLHTTSSIRDAAEVRIAGVLGIDVLGQFRAVFDPEKATVSLSDPSRAEPLPTEGKGVLEVRRERFGSRVIVPVEVAGTEIWPVLDTGATDTYINGDRLGLEPTSVLENARLQGSGGSGEVERTMRFYERDDVRMAGLEVPTVELTDRGRGPSLGGLLGLDILRWYRLELDLLQGVGRLTPVEPAELPSWTSWQATRVLPPAAHP